MTAAIQCSETFLIGDNSHGYEFAVGLTDGGWIGFAIGKLDNGERMMCVFPQVSDDGISLGMANRDAAIRLTGALAEDPENAYGGIETWFVTGDLRGKPADFRCDVCDRVGCKGVECRGDYDHYDDEDDL